MPTAEALVSGWEIYKALATSPLILAISLVTLLLGAATARGLLPGSRLASGRARRIAAGLSIAIAILLPLGTPLLSVDPTRSYGVTLDGTTLEVRFYQHRAEQYDACRASLKLTSVEEALNMLSIRTYGTSDPAAGVHIGYYKLRDGKEATVIILAKQAESALIIEENNKTSIVAVPGVEKVYQAALQACR